MRSSPMQFRSLRTNQVMLLVVLATSPAIAINTWFFGVGTLLNITLAILIGMLVEALSLRIRQLPVRPALQDYSLMVSALLFAIAIPPGSPWWLTSLGILFAIGIAKHAFGGLGQNVFNPAMAGYLFLLLAFPLQMTAWHLPEAAIEASDSNSPLSLTSMTQSLGFLFAGPESVDGFAMATPLIESKLASQSAVLEAINNDLNLMSRAAETGWELFNWAYLAGGLFLLATGIISWHIPVSIIATVLLLSFLFYSPASASIVGTPYLHLFGSATMVGAFFIATDPVTAATSNPARFMYGVIIGISIYSIRVWGSYLDSIAIAVLFGNFCAPLLDHYLRPRIFGHRKRKETAITPRGNP